MWKCASRRWNGRPKRPGKIAMKSKSHGRSGNIYRRLESLENDFVNKSATLHFADGSTEKLNASGDLLIRLLGYACRPEEAPPEYARKLELIRRAVDFEEPDGGQMINLTWALLHTPV
jgi:hypothetical protein